MGGETGTRAAEAGPFRGGAKKQKIVMKLPQGSVRILGVPATATWGEIMVKPARMLKLVPALAVIAALGATVASAGPIEDRQAAMKQNGKISTPPRKSTVAIGAATAPPKAASAKPIPKVRM